MNNHYAAIINFNFNKEIGDVPNCLSDADGLTDSGNINSRYAQALELHCGDLLNCHRYFRLSSSLNYPSISLGMGFLSANRLHGAF
jgi:hypothetical protein